MSSGPCRLHCKQKVVLYMIVVWPCVTYSGIPMSKRKCKQGTWELRVGTTNPISFNFWRKTSYLMCQDCKSSDHQKTLTHRFQRGSGPRPDSWGKSKSHDLIIDLHLWSVDSHFWQFFHDLRALLNILEELLFWAPIAS